jgi:hypothetical protein
MCRLNPIIEEVMEFQSGLSAKQNLEKVLESCDWIALFRPLKQILLCIHNFCRFAYSLNKSWRRNSLLGVRPNLTPLNSQKLLTEPTSPQCTGVEIQTFQLTSNDPTSDIENTIFIKSKNFQTWHGPQTCKFRLTHLSPKIWSRYKWQIGHK